MPVNLHNNWRDCKAWKDHGLDFSTTSDQAVKLFDATLTQYVGWYDDDSVGGPEKSLEKMIAADPNFAMGRVMSIGLDLMGTARNIRTDPSFLKEVEELEKMNKGLNWRESKHVDAVKLWSHGQCERAALVWEDILSEYPQDMLALKFAHDHYFYFGRQYEMRDSIARVFPSWTENMPLYGYLYGMHSFGLVETNLYADAEAAAKKGLEINAYDAWATHSLAHVYEMEGRSLEGLKFMSTTMNDWKKCGMLACHNFWHWALYHIERNQHQAAVDIFDKEISQRCKSGAWLDLVDACSMLFRLEMEGIKVGTDRWEQVYEVCRPHQDEHVTVFNDAHLLMACLGTKKPELASGLRKSIRKYVEEFSEKEEMGRLAKEIGIGMCEALQHYDRQDFDKSVEALLPIKYKIVQIGGSNAQRDVFDLMFLNAAMKSDKHQNLCRNLIYQRKALKKDSPMNDRLMAKWAAKHEHR